MNSKQRYNAKRAAEHRAKKAAERHFENGIVTTLMGCSLNVARATSSPSLRDKQEGGGVCLPEIAIYNAGYRTVRKDAVHIVK
ncbi:hypothetical protein HX773_19075 [Pantoea sp. B9002]|uniref:transcriptional antitermination N peptide n=1 Tax=Pantoea sp. B9002 TaxID=2726979 RepID=UPI0015A0650A|nr:hypothetical protein [Pantoea sp. B9002]NWA63012.1 hypothetical protein [Pantoea sp. B9002]